MLSIAHQRPLRDILHTCLVISEQSKGRVVHCITFGRGVCIYILFLYLGVGQEIRYIILSKSHDRFPIIVYWSIHMKTMVSGSLIVLSSNITAHRVSFRHITLIILICKEIPFLNYELYVDWLFVAINQIVLKLLRGFPCQLTYAWRAIGAWSDVGYLQKMYVLLCLYHFYKCSWQFVFNFVYHLHKEWSVGKKIFCYSKYSLHNSGSWYSDTCLRLTSLGPIFAFGIDRCSD